jgi:aldose sugar dehydrogenase
MWKSRGTWLSSTTEQCLGLSVILPSGDVRKLMGMGDAADYASNHEDLFCEGQAGMNGVALDPDFDAKSNH